MFGKHSRVNFTGWFLSKGTGTMATLYLDRIARKTGLAHIAITIDGKLP